MLQPANRLTLIDSMRPPAGFHFESAMAVTYTLDLRPFWPRRPHWHFQAEPMTPPMPATRTNPSSSSMRSGLMPRN